MALMTPIGTIRVFVDGKPIPCELSRVQIEENEHVNGKYRLIVHFKADDDERHLIMCFLKTNQEVSANSDTQEQYCYSTYNSVCGAMKLSICLKPAWSHCQKDKKTEDKNSDLDYEIITMDNNGEDGFYHEIYMTNPDTKTDTFTFGVAWGCDMDAEGNTVTAAESALNDEAEETVSMFDADDDHTEDYGISLEDYYQYSARGGNMSAMVMLGYMYEEGTFGSPDLDKALEYFQMALDNGDADAEEDIKAVKQKMLEEEQTGYEDDEDPSGQENIVHRIKNSKEEGNTAFRVVKDDDTFNVDIVTINWEDIEGIKKMLDIPEDLQLYSDYLESSKDDRKFIAIFSPLFNRPYPKVLFLKYSVEGKDLILNDITWEDSDFLNAVRKNYFEPSDDDRRLDIMIKKGLDEEDLSLLRTIGNFCKNGEIFEQDYKAARRIFEICAKGGNVDALNDLAVMYDNGYGVMQDVSFAKVMYESAAERGSTEALVNLGKIYEFGKLGEADYDKAIEYYQKAADTGEPFAEDALENAKRRHHMTRFNFQMFLDDMDGKLARLETTGDNEIPVNILIDNYEEVKDFKPQPCIIDVCGIGSDVDIFKSEEEFAKADVKMSPISMIPAGTFSADPDNVDFKQNPYIVFCGTVEEAEFNAEAKEEEANYWLIIQTLEMEINLYIRYDGVIEKGDIVYAVAWLFGNMYWSR